MFGPLRMRSLKGWRAVLLSMSVALVMLVLVSPRYIWLHVSRKPAETPRVADLSRDPEVSTNPEALLTEANRLAWLFNWPKAGPLYVRAEELFKERGDTRNEIYARVGRV